MDTWMCGHVDVWTCGRLTTERRGAPVQQHAPGGAHGGVGSQGRAQTLLAVHAGAHVVAAELVERTRVHQEVTRAEHR